MLEKKKKKKIKRHTVVRHKDGVFYGRVIRVLPDGKIFWLCGGYHFHITSPENLLLENFKGSFVEKHWFSGGGKKWCPMSSLRRLKKKAAWHHGEFAHNTPLDYEFITKD